MLMTISAKLTETEPFLCVCFYDQLGVAAILKGVDSKCYSFSVDMMYIHIDVVWLRKTATN